MEFIFANINLKAVDPSKNVVYISVNSQNMFGQEWRLEMYPNGIDQGTLGTIIFVLEMKKGH